MFKGCVEKARIEKELMKRKNHWQAKKGRQMNSVIPDAAAPKSSLGNDTLFYS